VHGLARDDGQVRFEVDADQLNTVMRQLTEYGVRSIVARPPTLEQLLLRHYGDDQSRATNDSAGGSA
jgi:ABC-2 type transport system ATP-binding protein